MRKSRLLIAALGVIATAASGQTVPIRTIGPILATSTENVGPAVTIRATSDGHVIVGAGARQRVYAFDSTLQKFTIVADSGVGTGTLAIRMTGLIPYAGDSTLLPDFNANAFQVIDASGKQVRSIAPPNTKDLPYLGIPSGFGRPGLDAKGRLVYRTMLAPPGAAARIGEVATDPRAAMMTATADTSPIVRGDFDTRKIDTLGWMKAPPPGRTTMDLKMNPSGGAPTVTVHVLVNPFPMSDEWVLLSDGSVAIVRVQDYHIDWVDPDGTRRSTPKMPVDWRKYTDAERAQRIDTTRKIVDEQVKLAAARVSSTPGMPQLKFDVSMVPDSEFPGFWPLVQPGAVLADLDAHLWVLPTTSLNAANGLTYDVINKEGTVFERVQLPKGRALAGFGPHDAVYMTRSDGKGTYLERAVLSPPPR
ncbi:MAG TPA: hypothetical protein VIV65_11925 [Gemmatimonadaceae bacterium]